MIKREVFSIDSGVKVKFSGDIKKEQIVTMVNNCQSGGCDCMSSETKEKIKDISVGGDDGGVELNILGEISKQEIEEALCNSKVINEDKDI